MVQVLWCIYDPSLRCRYVSRKLLLMYIHHSVKMQGHWLSSEAHNFEKNYSHCQLDRPFPPLVLPALSDLSQEHVWQVAISQCKQSDTSLTREWQPRTPSFNYLWSISTRAYIEIVVQVIISSYSLMNVECLMKQKTCLLALLTCFSNNLYMSTFLWNTLWLKKKASGKRRFVL